MDQCRGYTTGGKQQVSSRWASKASSVYNHSPSLKSAWALSPIRSAIPLDSHRNITLILKSKQNILRLPQNQIKCTINVTPLTYPETIPPTPVHGKVISTKPVPGARMIRDHWAIETWASHLISLGLSFNCSMRILIVPTFTGTMGLGSVYLTRGLRICLYIKAFINFIKDLIHINVRNYDGLQIYLLVFILKALWPKFSFSLHPSDFLN